ncbi:MAG: nucleotidyltransferase domain-containing protein [Verrucomicrobia bacterium]|nr:nucleotidyltransferase domain-containing protein [Verrucomicrobiota bacterium]
MSQPIHLILSPGTRIVTRNDANRIGGGQLIAAGAVAVITDSPADAQHAYKVRFNDGAEAMLRRTEFSILKEFKNDEAVGRDSGRADADFQDWQPFIIYRCVVGSQAFGLSGDDSDVDRRGIYLPPAELHWSLYGVPEQIENNDTQEAYWELQKFLVMALKANPNILECLYTPLVEHATPLAQELVAARQRFLSKLIYQTYNGYVMSQFKKLEQDLRARGEIKWKHAMHLMRLLLAGISALREGDLRLRLDEERDALLTIKHGERPWSDVNAWRLRLHKEFDEAFASTRLPERPDYAWANEFLLKARKEMAAKE